MKLAGRTALVTGASSGLGERVALQLADRGVRVYAGVRTIADRRRLPRAHAGPTFVRLDIREQSDIDEVAARLAADVGQRGLDILVNNAGIVEFAPVEHVDLDALRQLFEVNLFGHVSVIQTMLPLLRRAAGRIVNIGSDAPKITLPIAGPYAASKAALEVLTAALRRETAAQDVSVVTVQPGTVRTRLWERIVDDVDRAAHTWTGHPSYRTFASGLLAVADRGRSAGVPPELVADAVVRVLERRRMPACHRVGWDARIRSLTIDLLSTRVLDAVVANRLAAALPATDDRSKVHRP